MAVRISAKIIVVVKTDGNAMFWKLFIIKIPQAFLEHVCCEEHKSLPNIMPFKLLGILLDTPCYKTSGKCYLDCTRYNADLTAVLLQPFTVLLMLRVFRMVLPT